MDFLLNLPVIGDIANLITGLLPQEPSFLDKLEGFFGNMGDVFTQLGNLNINFDQFNGVIDAIGKIFGA